MTYLLAVDGGATKTHTICATLDGKVVGEAFAGPTSLSIGAGPASMNLRESIRQATENIGEGATFKALAAGVAGLDTPAEETLLKDVFSKALSHLNLEHMSIVNDTVIGLESATNKPDAFILISGTGSNCWGRNSEGQQTKAGGMDFLLTDECSGYEIGREVLRRSVRSYDKRAEKTILEEMVLKHFQIPSIPDLKSKVYNPLLPKAEIAALSKVCKEAFDKDDKVAREIFDFTVTGGITMAKTVINELSMKEREVDCVLVGSVITEVDYLQNKFKEEIKAFCPKISFVFPEKAPVYGALKLAMKGQ